PVVFQLASPEQFAGQYYPLQARANYRGEFVASYNGQQVARQTVAAGELFSHIVKLSELNQFSITFLPLEGPQRVAQNHRFEVTQRSVADALQLYVAPDGKPQNSGTLQSPLDLATAVELLAPGGTIWLTQGDYPSFTLPLTASGTAGQLKKLQGIAGKVRFTGELLHQ